LVLGIQQWHEELKKLQDERLKITKQMAEQELNVKRNALFARATMLSFSGL